MTASLAFLLLPGVAAAADPYPTPPPSGSPHAFVCCDVEYVRLTVDTYLRLQQTLAGVPEKPPIKSQMYGLRGDVLAVSQNYKHTADEAATIDKLYKVVDQYKDGTTMDVIAHFDAITQGVLHLALGHQTPNGEFRIAEAFCPNVGSWLQQGTDFQNPYGTGNTCAQWR